jgi:hypothetical protein
VRIAAYLLVIMMVGLGGLEPPTSPLSGARSSHLSYRPDEEVLSNSSMGGWVGHNAGLRAIAGIAAMTASATAQNLHWGWGRCLRAPL